MRPRLAREVWAERAVSASDTRKGEYNRETKESRWRCSTSHDHAQLRAARTRIPALFGIGGNNGFTGEQSEKSGMQILAGVGVDRGSGQCAKDLLHPAVLERMVADHPHPPPGLSRSFA